MGKSTNKVGEAGAPMVVVLTLECPLLQEPLTDLGTTGSFPMRCFYSSKVLLLRNDNDKFLHPPKRVSRVLQAVAMSPHLRPFP